MDHNYLYVALVLRVLPMEGYGKNYRNGKNKDNADLQRRLPVKLDTIIRLYMTPPSVDVCKLRVRYYEVKWVCWVQFKG